MMITKVSSMMCVPIKKINFLSTDAELFSTIYIPRPYECVVRRLQFKTLKSTYNSDVQTQAYVETWMGWHPF